MNTLSILICQSQGLYKPSWYPKLLLLLKVVLVTSSAGTDATHAEHIETIKSRNYVGVRPDGRFVPGQLGMGLVEGWFMSYICLFSCEQHWHIYVYHNMLVCNVFHVVEHHYQQSKTLLANKYHVNVAKYMWGFWTFQHK